MEIVVAKDRNGVVVCIVAARNKSLALAYFHGQALEYDNAQTLDEMGVEDAIADGLSGVIPIMKTHKARIGEIHGTGTIIVRRT